MEHLQNRRSSKRAEVPDIIYLHVSLNIKPHRLTEFQDRMQEYLEPFYKRYGWELINAAYHITGGVNKFVHIWRLPADEKANAVNEVMTKGNNDDQYMSLQACIASTTQELTAALDYDPMMFGYQRDTVILDCNQAGWMLDNVKMMRMKAIPEAGLDDEVRQLAEEGAMTATLTSGKSLLFNLAQIAPKSCFQWPEKPMDGLLMAKTRLKPEFPKNIENFYVLTPWGKTYCFDKQDVETNGEYFTPEEIRTNERRLQTIIKSKVPLAAIPDPKDSIPGTGSMCYVINLASFKE